MTLILATKTGKPLTSKLPLPAVRRKAPMETRYQCGFTLLELLLVLGIAAMMAMLIGPGISSLDSPGFNAQVREATGLLNHARRMAVVQGGTTRVEFIVNPPDAGNSNGRDEPETADPSVVGRWVSVETELDYTDSTGRQSPVQEQLSIEFYPEGGSSGGTLEFSQDSRRLKLSIDPFSGRVERLDENDD
ncbi:MAG TPA: hypothetical protein DD407_04620 [Pseudohongiella sp.]|nr:hypothetical protein [Gammaproteobacteria bacterium]HBN14302.1 hypothetical protein [Pseudohongiella sp.]